MWLTGSSSSWVYFSTKLLITVTFMLRVLSHINLQYATCQSLTWTHTSVASLEGSTETVRWNNLLTAQIKQKIRDARSTAYVWWETVNELYVSPHSITDKYGRTISSKFVMNSLSLKANVSVYVTSYFIPIRTVNLAVAICPTKDAGFSFKNSLPCAFQNLWV
jgi:hypothetical protein